MLEHNAVFYAPFSKRKNPKLTGQSIKTGPVVYLQEFPANYDIQSLSANLSRTAQKKKKKKKVWAKITKKKNCSPWPQKKKKLYSKHYRQTRTSIMTRLVLHRLIIGAEISRGKQRAVTFTRSSLIRAQTAMLPTF